MVAQGPLKCVGDSIAGCSLSPGLVFSIQFVFLTKRFLDWGGGRAEIVVQLRWWGRTW